MTEEKKNLKTLIRFHSANKINNYGRGGGGVAKEKGKKCKKYKIIYSLIHSSASDILLLIPSSQSIRIINVFLESLLSESFPLLGVTVHLTSLGLPPTLC